MPELGRLQEAFARALTNAAEAPRAASLFNGTAESTLARLAVYRANLITNARNALASAYPITVKIVGEEFFESLARDYLRHRPPTSGDLNAYGDGFPEFVAEFPHTQDLSYLPDVARMEWLAHRAYYAKDSPPLDLRRISSAPESIWTELRPVLAPACALLESCWPLGRIWEVHQDAYAGEFSVDLDAGPDRVVIYRPRYHVRVASVTPGSFRFLKSVTNAEPILVALTAALAEEPEFNLCATLLTWVRDGVIVDFEAASRT